MESIACATGHSLLDRFSYSGVRLAVAPSVLFFLLRLLFLFFFLLLQATDCSRKPSPKLRYMHSSFITESHIEHQNRSKFRNLATSATVVTIDIGV